MAYEKKKVPYFPWLIAFESAARHGNFSRAAEEIGLTPSAVSQQIGNLEHKLGTKLFHRGPRGVELTETGHAYLPSVQTGFQHLQFGTKNLFGESASSLVTIKAGVTFSRKLMLPHLAEFQEQHPDIVLRFLATVWPETTSIVPEIDIEVSYKTSIAGGLGPVNAHEVWAMMACPDLAASWEQSQPQRLSELPLIQIMGTEHIWSRWFAELGLDNPNYEPNLIFDLGHFAVAAAKSGRGVVLASKLTAGYELSTGELVVLGGPQIADPASHRVFLAPRASERPAANIVANWLVKLCENAHRRAR